MNLNVQYLLLAACVPTSKDLNFIVGMIGLDMTMFVVGAGLMIWGWKTRAKPQRKEYAIAGAIFSIVAAIPWVVLLAGLFGQ